MAPTTTPAKQPKKPTKRRTCKFRIYPNRTQQKILLSWLESLRGLYNEALEIRERSYNAPVDYEILRRYDAAMERPSEGLEPWILRIGIPENHKISFKVRGRFFLREMIERAGTVRLDQLTDNEIALAIDGFREPMSDEEWSEACNNFRRQLREELNETAPDNHKSKSETYNRQSKWLTDWRKRDRRLSLILLKGCRDPLRRLDRAYQSFFKKIAGYPHPAEYGEYCSVVFEKEWSLWTKDGKLKVPGCGNIKIKRHKEVDENTIKTVGIKHVGNKWYALLSLDLGELPSYPNDNDAVALVIGPGYSLATSDPSLPTIDVPRPLAANLDAMRKLQRKISESTRIDADTGRPLREQSNTWHRRSATLSKKHAILANQRMDYQHKTSDYITKKYGTIYYTKCYQSPKDDKSGAPTREGQKGRDRRRAVADAGWFSFIQMLRYKADDCCAKLVEVRFGEPRNENDRQAQASGEVVFVPEEPFYPLSNHERARLVLDRAMAVAEGTRRSRAAKVLPKVCPSAISPRAAKQRK